jgi:hypothetical protein
VETWLEVQPFYLNARRKQVKYLYVVQYVGKMYNEKDKEA